MVQKKWQKIAQQEFAAMDKQEQADWLDLRIITEKRK